jgi:hypothetical protein
MGQLSGHLRAGVVQRSAEKWGVRDQTSSKWNKGDSWAGTYNLWSSQNQTKSEESGIEQLEARSATRGTAERALTIWVHQTSSERGGELALENAQSTNKGTAEQALTVWRRPIFNQNERLVFEQERSTSKWDSWAGTHILEWQWSRREWSEEIAVSFWTWM